MNNVILKHQTDFGGWRQAARTLVLDDVKPTDVTWSVEGAGMLPLDIDPKLAWALRHRDRFPLDVASASREELLRVPGFGTKAVDRIIATRRVTSIRAADLGRLHIPKQKALPFIVLCDHSPSPHLLDAANLAQRFKPKAAQLGFGF